MPPAQSTIVADTEPCSPFLEFNRFSLTDNRATMEPFSASTISMSDKKNLYTGEPPLIRSQHALTLAIGVFDIVD